MRSIRLIAGIAVLTSGWACGSLDVPNLNAPSVAGLGPDATPSAIATAVQGLIAGTRSSATGIVGTLGAYGREGMNLDPSNPQGAFNTYQLLDQDAWSGTWLSSYRNMAQANLILASLGGVAGLTDQQKEGIRGFAKTVKAIDLYQVIVALDVAGAALDAPDDPAGPLPPIATRAQVYQRILQLLEEGKTHLQAGGSGFAFGLPAGFTGFTTPADFLKFNRAYKARIEVMVGNYPAALTALGESFLSTSAPVTLGVYHNFSTNSGDAANSLYDPTTHQRFAHPSIWPDAKLKPDGTKDNRVLAKVAPIPPLNRTGFTVSEKMTVYN
ncbi:MAG: RagB/SusD family nutrient uptake outer membrane protein, partial [Gemmatimonadetes bacterium]|nr:RagB/SusD family nutrient uptake outer membrane protein [Gemmatimonadota bacterium]